MQQDIRKYYIPTKSSDPNLSCTLCNQLALHPVECQKCENLFCKHCVENQQKQKDKCPLDCEGAFETKQPHRLVRDQFNKILFHCINKTQGCDAENRMDDVMHHSKSCEYVQTKCICDWTGLKIKLNDHQKNCDHFQTKICDLCKMELNRIKFKNHNCIHDLKEKLSTISEKFYDYKEATEYSIIELKNQVRGTTDELVALKGEIVKLGLENKQLKECVVKLLAYLEEKNQPKQNVQQQQQQNIPHNNQQQETDSLYMKNNLTEAEELHCEKNHKLYFWKGPSNDNAAKQNKCSKCTHVLGTIKFAYVCIQCRVHFCLKCQNPELFYEKQQKTVQCPQKQLMKRFEDENFRCSVCEKKAESLIKPLALKCDDCGLIECYQCIKNKKYVNKERIVLE